MPTTPRIRGARTLTEDHEYFAPAQENARAQAAELLVIIAFPLQNLSADVFGLLRSTPLTSNPFGSSFHGRSRKVFEASKTLAQDQMLHQK